MNNKPLPINYVEAKENGKRKFRQVTTMVMSLNDCIDYVKTCKKHAKEYYNKDFIYRITTIYDNNEREVTIIWTYILKWFMRLSLLQSG